MKGHYILIDPFARTVTAIEPIPDGQMGHTVGPDYMDVVTLTRNDDGVACCLAVDDMGLYRDDQRFWSFSFHMGQIYAGKGLMFAANAKGESISLQVPAEIVADTIIWRDVKFAGMNTTEGMEHSELLGTDVFTITTKPRFEPGSE